MGKDITYRIPKEKMYLLTESLKKSDKACYIIFSENGNFVYAASDTQRIKQSINEDTKK